LNTEIAEIEAYLESEGLEYETDPSGIRYVVLQEGTGEGPNYCASVAIDYTGSKLGSTDIFSSGIDTQFSLRSNSVVPGFKIAISIMNINADYRVYIPASLLNVKGVSQLQPANLPLGENVEFRIRLTRY
jgi:FKBP-type peptidyl-prolyl cis-trans isomerase